MAKRWIAGAIKKPGSFTKEAKAAGKTVRQYAEEKKGASGLLGKRARLALILEGMHGSGKTTPKDAGDKRGKNAKSYQIG